MAIGVLRRLKPNSIERRVYVLIGDGETNEGSIWEAVLLAGDLGLANLTAILINNYSSTRNLGDIAAKFELFGWQAARWMAVMRNSHRKSQCSSPVH